MKACALRAYLTPWLESFIKDHPFISGAYLAGSAAEKRPEDDLAGCSDIDIMLTIDGPAREKPGKLPHGDFVIEGTYVAWDTIADPEHALSDYHVAHGLSRGKILFDRDGRLTSLCETVAREFSKPERIRQRIDGVFAKIEGNLRGFNPELPLENRMMGLLFSAGILCHAVLVAAQKNPTVRMRYRETHALGLPDVQERLLRAAGFADITAEDARLLIAKMAHLFDLVSPVCRTHFPYTGDLLPDMRKSAVDDLLALVERGLARECMFWVCATFTRLMAQAHADAPDIYAQNLPELQNLAQIIGIGSPESEKQRISAILQEIPAFSEICNKIILQN